MISTFTYIVELARIFAVKKRLLLESLEGKKGQPRLKPPFPANAGVWGCPTTVNNVETIAVVPTILRRSAAGLLVSGAKTIPARRCFVYRATSNKPCVVVEEEMSIPLA